MNINEFNRGIPLNGLPIKLLLIMKLTTFILILALAQVSAKGLAQKITLNTKNTPIEKVLQSIRDQSGYEVIYKTNDLKNEKVSLNLKNASIEEAMEELIKGIPYTFEIVNNNVVLSRSAPSFFEKALKRFSTVIISGTVSDEQDNFLPGATVKLQGSKITTRTNEQGIFSITSDKINGVLVISYLGYETLQVAFGETNTGPFNVILKEEENGLKEIEVVSTGYQSIPKERATGSFTHVDNKLLNRSVSTNVLDRIKNVAPGIYFQDRDPQLNAIAVQPRDRNLGITIRGESTFSASKQPLIILDNFPYDGEVGNINPNDIETVTILKDASAASIWGARSGNGVIVITTKKGKFNEKLNMSFNANATIIDKPDLKYSPAFLDAGSFIETEQYLFDKGYFNDQLIDNFSFPAISPAVEQFVKFRDAVSSEQKAEAQRQLDLLKNNDVREDYRKYVYQKAINQQYSLGVRGGTNTMKYSLSVGNDQNRNNLIGNSYNRTTINSLNTFRPFRILELNADITYTKSNKRLNNDFAYGNYSGVGYPYFNIYPYAKLADENEGSLALSRGMRTSYLDLMQSQGFLNWKFRPLDELKFSDNETKVSDLLLRFGGNLQLLPQLTLLLNYQNERQIIAGRNLRSADTYYTRDLINKFSVLNPSTGAITYNLPNGGILDLSNTDWYSNAFRGQLNFDQNFNKHNVGAILGAEVKELNTVGYVRTSYGYNDQFGTAANTLNYSFFFPTNPYGSSLIPTSNGGVFGFLNRNVSYYAIGNYEYNSKYTLNISARRDGANLFGAKINDKIKPFFSAGLGWSISKEPFYTAGFLSYLRLRATYGYQGNTYDLGSSYLTGVYGTDAVTGAPRLNISTAPNPRLQWEQVKNINLGVDFESKGGVFRGSIELYEKEGANLIQPTDLAPQTGFNTFQANTASTKTKGLDLNLKTINLNRVIKWETILLFSAIKDKVVKYDAPLTSASISSYASYAVGKPLYALFSYKWEGLNPDNGNPRGNLNGQPSEDYAGIINNFKPDSLVYNGSQIPTVYGAIRNDFSYKTFSLSINLTYRLGYVFRRSSMSLNYTELIQSGQHVDYLARWQKAGDENSTNVPSLVYPENYQRSTFYQNSETLVESGDHIRLQDIRLSFNPSSRIFKRLGFSSLSFYGYANNIGIVWSKNKLGIDPSAVGSGQILYPNPFSLSFGLTANY